MAGSERQPGTDDSVEPESSVRFWRCESERAEAQATAREIEHLLAAGEVRPEAVCVIVGSGWREARLAAAALEERSVPFRFAGDAALFQRPEVRDVLAWLRMLADPTDYVTISAFSADGRWLVMDGRQWAAYVWSVGETAEGPFQFRGYEDALSALAVADFWTPRYFSLDIEEGEWPSFAAFVICALMAFAWSSQRRRAQYALEATVQQRTADLVQANAALKAEMAEREADQAAQGVLALPRRARRVRRDRSVVRRSDRDVDVAYSRTAVPVRNRVRERVRRRAAEVRIGLVGQPGARAGQATGEHDVPVTFGGCTSSPGRTVFSDDDGIVVL